MRSYFKSDLTGLHLLADAAFRISLARFSSRLSRSGSRRRSFSEEVVPESALESTWARRIHLRSVSAVMPHLAAIDVIAAHSGVYSSRCSSTSRTVRSRTSRGYLFDLVITPSSQGLESLTFPGRFTYLLAQFFGSGKGIGYADRINAQIRPRWLRKYRIGR